MSARTHAPLLPSDRQLLDAVRRGSDVAWNELLARHRRPLQMLLHRRRRRTKLDGVLADLRVEMASVATRPAGDPDVRSFRPRVLALVFDGSYGPAASPDADGAESLAMAFARLPEPWQTALWHRNVEGADDATVAQLVGRSVDDVPDLVDTARGGLTDAFVVECGGSVSPGLDAAPLAELIDRHLAAVIVPRLSGHTVGDHRRAATRCRGRRRSSTRMI